VQNVSFSAFNGDLCDQFLEILIDGGVQTFDDCRIKWRVITSHLIDNLTKLQFGHSILGKGNVDELQYLFIVLYPFDPYFGI
jgi:hypothetical protein